jgi:hypothetical protein
MLHKYSSNHIPFSRSFHCFQHYPPSHKFHTIRTFFTHQSQHSLFIYRFALPTIGNNLKTFEIFPISQQINKIFSIIFSPFSQSHHSLYFHHFRAIPSYHNIFAVLHSKFFSTIFVIYFTIFHHSMRFQHSHHCTTLFSVSALLVKYFFRKMLLFYYRHCINSFSFYKTDRLEFFRKKKVN